MLKFFLTAFACLFPLAAAGEAYKIPDTDVLKLHSASTGADYRLFVSAPRACREEGAACRVVYMLDADYSFAIVRNVIQHFAERGNLPPTILVAIAYPDAAKDRDVYRLNRTRDYTPTFVAEGGYGAHYQKLSGGAPKFIEFIAAEAVPAIEKRYKAASDDRTIIGHSFGGLFAAYALLAKPELFDRYVIVSPSLWYDDGFIFRLEQEQAASGDALAGDVFLAVGAIENQRMSDDLITLNDRLRARGGGLRVDIRIFPDETHNSVFPGAVTRGLLKVFDAFPALAPPAVTSSGADASN